VIEVQEQAPVGIHRGMTINLAAIFYLVALVLAFIAATWAPAHPRLVPAAIGFLGAGLFCSATGLGD
jgi:hypothetical protein